MTETTANHWSTLLWAIVLAAFAALVVIAIACGIACLVNATVRSILKDYRY